MGREGWREVEKKKLGRKGIVVIIPLDQRMEKLVYSRNLRIHHIHQSFEK